MTAPDRALHSLPLFVRLQGRAVILLGEGEAADAKRRLLDRAGAVVVGEDAVAALAIVAIEAAGAAEAAVARLKARGVLVNAVDRPALCDFTLPAIVDRAPVLVAIGTGGVSAGLAAALRQRLEAVLPAGLGRVAEGLYAARDALKARYPDGAARRRALAAAMRAGGALDLLVERDPSSIAFALSLSTGDGVAAANGIDAGRVSTGSARTQETGRGETGRGETGRGETGRGETGRGETGRGETGVIRIALASRDPDDLTLRQARLLANADRVCHRADVPRAILDRARADAAREVCDVAPPDRAGTTLFVEMA